MCCVTSFPQYKFFFPDLRSFFLKDNNGIAEIEQGPTTLLGEVHLHVYIYIYIYPHYKLRIFIYAFRNTVLMLSLLCYMYMFESQ